MAINFPSSPVLNQQYAYNGRTWRWNGYAWVLDVNYTINLAYDQANTAYNVANLAFNKANTSMDYAYVNTSVAGANAWVNTVFGYSNTYTQTVGATSNGWTNTSVAGANAWTNTVFGYSNSYTQTVGAASNGWVNTSVAGANAWSNTKVSSVTGTAGQIYSSGGTTPTLNLITTAVTAATYGGATQVPYFTVDSYGRLTLAGNVAISAGAGGGYYDGNRGPQNASNYGDIFRIHSNTLSTNVTIYSGNNALCAGPVTISTGQTLTIQTGSRVSIV